jgi:hypothetical protein
MKKFLTLIILIFYASSLFAQVVTFNQEKIKQKHYFQEIPYQEIKGIIIAPVTINGKEYNFIFDTGASSLAISDKIYKELNLRVFRQTSTRDASGKKEKVRSILFPEIELQGITFRNTMGIVFSENSEFSKWCECLEIDGIIGGNMLRNFIVQFDEQHKQIIITNDIKRVLLENREYEKMKQSSGKIPCINITLQKGAQRVHHNVLFDSGDIGGFFTLSLNKSNSRVVDRIAETEGASGDAGFHGFFGKQKHLLLNIPKLDISGTIFNNVIITATQGMKSRIGNRLLQYGKTTFDYKKKRFYFEPFDSICTTKPVENPWTINYTYQNNKWVVGIIWDKRLESQINLGDEILSINGIDVQSMSFCELFLEIPPSDKLIYVLKDINTGDIKKVEIERMQLVK